MKSFTYDPDLFKTIKDQSQELRSQYSTANTQDEQLEKMFRMDYDEAEVLQKKGFKVTISPGPRIAAMGIERLMSASEPRFQVPYQKDEPGSEDISNKIERMAKTIWRQASRISGRPIEADVVLSHVLYDRSCIAITSTQDLMAAASNYSPAQKARVEYVASCTPFLFKVFNPRTVYAERDNLGLNAIVVVSDTTMGKLVDDFGEDCVCRVFGSAPSSRARYDIVTLWHYWNLEYRVTWAEGKSEPLVFEEHGLPFIPFVYRVGEGSLLFDKIEDQLDPFLLTLYKSGFWKRASLVNSAMYTGIERFGLGPAFVESLGPTSSDLTTIDASVAGMTRYVVPPGNSFTVLQSKGLTDMAFKLAMDVAEQKETETTVYRTALGQPMASATSFSEVALTAQAGRLPLIPIQRAAGWAISDALKVSFGFMRYEKGKYKSWDTDGKEWSSVELSGSDVPEHLEIDTVLDVKLPQDKLQQVNMASMIKREGLADTEWIQENFMGIDDTSEMRRSIWKERAEDMLFQIWLQGKGQQLQQAAQQQMQMQQQMQQQMMQPPPGMGPGMGPGGPGGPGGQGIPPEILQQMQMQGQQPPGPGMTGLPPEMAQMGGQPPQGLEQQEGMPAGNPLEQLMGGA